MSHSIARTNAIGRLRQGGFSMIELLVSLLIATFLMGVMLSSYLSVKTSFSSQGGLAELQDSERLLLTVLTTSMQFGGYFVDPTHNTAVSALPGTAVSWPNGTSASFAPGQAVVGAGDSSGTGAASDTVAVQFQTASGDGLLNCVGAGNNSGAPALALNSFAVNDSNELTCTVGLNGVPVALVGNVARMQIAYGTDTNGDGSSDTYLSANAITLANLWSNVHTARVTISFLNPLSANGATLPNALVQSIDLKNRQ